MREFASVVGNPASRLTNPSMHALAPALTEGCSIRATERMTGTHRDTIMCLGVRVGGGCAALHDTLFRNLNTRILELDEIWSYVGKKQKRTKPEDGADKGDQYTFTALDADSKAIVAYRVGKRDGDVTRGPDHERRSTTKRAASASLAARAP